jgi:hypothetical protein
MSMQCKLQKQTETFVPALIQDGEVVHCTALGLVDLQIKGEGGNNGSSLLDWTYCWAEFNAIVRSLALKAALYPS